MKINQYPLILTRKNIFSSFEDKSVAGKKIINLTNELEKENYSIKDIYTMAHSAGFLYHYIKNQFEEVAKKPVYYLSSVALETEFEEFSNYDFHRYKWIQKIKFPDTEFYSNKEKEKVWKHLSELQSPKKLAKRIIESEHIWRNSIWDKNGKYSPYGANDIYGTSEYMKNYPKDQIEFAMSNENYPINGNCYVDKYNVIYFKLNFDDKRNLKLSIHPSKKIDKKIIDVIMQYKS